MVSSSNSRQFGDTAAARELGRGLTRLNFEQPLEDQFRRAHWKKHLAWRRGVIVFFLLVVLSVTVLDYYRLGEFARMWSIGIRLGLVTPILLITLSVSFTRYARRWLDSLIVLMVTGSGIAIVTIYFVALTHGDTYRPESFYIICVGTYFLSGLLFWHATLSSLSVLVCFALGSALTVTAGVPTGIILIWLLAMNLVGILGCYQFERRARTTFLTRTILAETAQQATSKEEELEALNEIVMAVNQEYELTDVLDSVLTQGIRLFPRAEKGTIILRDEDVRLWRVVAAIGYDLEPNICFDMHPIAERYTESAIRMADGIYLSHDVPDPPFEVEGYEKPVSMLLMTLEVEARIVAFLILYSLTDRDAFDQADIARMARFRQHALSAVANARMLKQMVAQQRQLAVSGRMASLGVLTAGIAHEINNPTNFAYVGSQNLEVELSRFREFLRTLAKDADESVLVAIEERFEGLQKILDDVLEGNKRIRDIVRDLQSFTHLDEAESREVDVVDQLETTLRLIRPRFKLVAEFETDFRARPQLRCFPSRLNQVFMNILVNACQAVEERAESERDYQGRIMVRVRERSDWIEISIEDNGVGISETTREHIFEPFFTTKPVGTGTGLGLAITFTAIEDLDGELHIDSEPGRGSNFVLRLPLAQGANA